MDAFDLSTVPRLYIWRGLYSSHLFGPGQDKRRQQKNDLDVLLKPESIVRARRGSRLPKLCQKKHALRVVYRPPESTCSKPPIFTRSVPLPRVSPPPTGTDSVSKAAEPSKSFVQPASEIALSLLRRPMGSYRFPPSKLESREVRKVLRSRTFRQVGADDFDKNVTFYEDHFPILVETFDTVRDRHYREKLAVMNRNRCRDVNLRIKKLDARLTNVQRQYQRNDEDFLTQLRTPTFDPRVWPWNSENYCVVEDTV